MKTGNRKRWISMLLLIVMTVELLFAAGCGQTKEAREKSVFTGDADALKVFVRGNSDYAESLMKQFPDIKFDFYYYGGLNASMTMMQLLENDDLGDICISSLQASGEVAEEHLMDLSGRAFCSRFEPSILNQFDVDGKIYQIPGYVSTRNVIYNKTMFEEHGWKEPMTFDELVALCKQIRKETPDITPIVMGGAAGGYYFTTMTTYAQADFLYTLEGQQWMRDYQKGKAKAEDGFGSGIEMTQQLIDADAFDFEKNLDMWDAGLFQERMMNGEAAMMFAWGEQTRIAQCIMDEAEDEFAIMPFRNHDGHAFIGTNISYYIGLSKKLEEKGQEKKLENALRVVDYLASEEGMKCLSKDNLSAISPLKKAENAEVFELYRNFWDENLDSIKAPMLYSGFEDILDPVADMIMDAVKGNGDLSGVSNVIDEIHQKYVSEGAEGIEAGTFAENFTHEETVQLYANMFYEKGDSDLALVSDGSYRNGVANKGGAWLRFFEGPVIEDCLTCTIPGMCVMDPAEQLTLTGKQIKELLENGKCSEYKETTGANWTEVQSEEEYFDYYWAGADVKWKDNLVESITLADGRKVEDEETYTVTFPIQDYTEDVGEIGNPKSLTYTSKDLLRDYLKTNSPVEPPEVLR